jgi:hypothetical protein
MLLHTALENMETVRDDFILCLQLIHRCAPGFDEGSPDGHDPLQLARAMAGRGITLVSHVLCTLWWLKLNNNDSSLLLASQH